MSPSKKNGESEWYDKKASPRFLTKYFMLSTVPYWLYFLLLNERPQAFAKKKKEIFLCDSFDGV